MAEQQQGGRNQKRPRVEANKSRDALLHVQDKYADIDFTRLYRAYGRHFPTFGRRITLYTAREPAVRSPPGRQ